MASDHDPGRAENYDSGRLDFDSGLDRHTWSTQWEGLQGDLADTPREAIPDTADVVHEMLRELGYPVDDPFAAETTEDPTAEWAEVARVAGILRGAGGDVTDEEVEDTVDRLRRLYAFLIDDRSEGRPLAGGEPGDPGDPTGA
jgi:hypothetical protein